jgi:glycosyltransferase involved in cell wall biosynthesis
MSAERRHLSVLVDGIVYGFQRHGGINTFFNEVLSRLSKRGDVSLAIELPAECGGEFEITGVSAWRPPLPSSTGISWKLDQLAGPVFLHANDLVAKLRRWHFGVRNWPYVFLSTYFSIATEGIPQVGLVHDMNHEIFPDLYPEGFGKWLRTQYPRYLAQAKEIIAVSETTKKDVIEIYKLPAERIHVVYHSVNSAIFHPRQNEEDSEVGDKTRDEPYILYVGSRAKYKNFDRLLRAFAESSVRNSLCLTVAGPDWNAVEIEEITRLDLQSRVRLIVRPSDEVLAGLYQRATAFVYPSVGEGFGIPLLEAMACETLILASDISVFHEIAGDAALYFDPFRIESISAALESVLAESVRAEYISKGRRCVTKYSWDDSAEQVYSICRKALL